MSKTSRKKKRNLIIIVIIALLCLIGGAVGAYFALVKVDDDFDVDYQIDVAASVTGMCEFGGTTITLPTVHYDPTNPNQSPNQTMDFGLINLTKDHYEMYFLFSFTNNDDISMKVTMVDECEKVNIGISTEVFKEGETVQDGDASAGFIVLPQETWSVKITVKVQNLDRNATYRSSGDTALTWWLVGME